MHTREWLTATILAVLLVACDGRSAASAEASDEVGAGAPDTGGAGAAGAVEAQDDQGRVRMGQAETFGIAVSAILVESQQSDSRAHVSVEVDCK